MIDLIRVKEKDIEYMERIRMEDLQCEEKIYSEELRKSEQARREIEDVGQTVGGTTSLVHRDFSFNDKNDRSHHRGHVSHSVDNWVQMMTQFLYYQHSRHTCQVSVSPRSSNLLTCSQF